MTALKIISPSEIPIKTRTALRADILSSVSEIVDDVKKNGENAVIQHATRLGDLNPGQSLFVSQEEQKAAFASLSQSDQDLLKRSISRVRTFAETQRKSVSEVSLKLPGGSCGHKVTALQSAGCYVPGGRYPLPSSLIMTTVTAHAAGVENVWVASPKPSQVTLAAAAAVGVSGFLRVGGAQAIAALAFGTSKSPTCDVIVGPGNSWVTAAKFLVSAYTKIDMLAGPSELVVLADDSANPKVIASDLLAQAEHDVEALPILVTPSRKLADEVSKEVQHQLATLSTAETASAAVRGGYAVIVRDISEGISVCNTLAPEHLEVQCQNASAVSAHLNTYGGLFVGAGSAEVLGDYCSGPNHVLPTGGTARSRGGLSVLDFLAVRTWLQIDDVKASQELSNDAVQLARLEGLEAHARSAEQRLKMSLCAK